MTDQDQPRKPVSEARRCTQAMQRLHDVLTQEFPDLRPPHMIFVLQWLTHTIFLDINDVVGNVKTGPRPPEPDPVFKN